MQKTYRNIVVLTGAGISAESGIQTFRGGDGLWEGHRIEDVATPEAFIRQPKLVQHFYNLRRHALYQPHIQANAAHLALAQFEKTFPGNFLLVTQNVDDLHERAGSKKVLHMHGELLKARCLDTHEVFHWDKDLDELTPHPHDPSRKGRLRPHIVWFGEMPLYLDVIYAALAECDLFVSIGTSGVVYPAAGFVQETTSSCRRVEINIEPSHIGSLFEESTQGPATQTVPSFFASI